MACRSRPRSPVEASEQIRDDIYLDGEIDFEFPMLTDEDIDCIVQDISDAGSGPLGSIAKPLAIDAIQKHVEESLLFLDDDESTIEKSENKTGASDQKSNIVLENPGSDVTIMQDVDDSSINIEMDVNDKNRGETFKQENINDASLPYEQQKDKSQIESLRTENKVDSLYVKEETSNILEQMVTSDVIPSLEDNSISDRVLNEMDTAMNDPQEETSGFSEQSDTVKVIVLQEDNPQSDCVVNESDVSLKQKSEIPLLTGSNKANVVSLENNPISDCVLIEMNKNAGIDNSEEVTRDITEQIDSSKVIVSQEDNSPSDSAVYETDKGAVANVCLEQKSEIPFTTDGKKANIVSLEDNPTSDPGPNEVLKDADAATNDAQEKKCDITEQVDTNKVIVLQEDNPLSDSVVHQMDTDPVVNVSLEQESGISQLTDTKKANIESLEDNPISDSVLNEINTDAMNNDSENKPCELSGLSYGNKVRNSLQEDNSFLSMLNETHTDAIKSLCSSDISKQSDASKVCNASKEDNPSFMLNETDTDAEIMNVLKNTSDISIGFHEGISRSDSLLDETDADVTMNYDSQEELGDNSKKMITYEIGNDLQEQKSPSESFLGKTDSDANMDDTQDGISDIPQQNYEMDLSNVSREDNRSSEGVLDETDEAINGPTKETSDKQDINEISNISQDNSVLNESDTDAEMNFSPEIPEQIEIKNVHNTYKYNVLNETDTDVTINDSQEEISDISELIDSKEVSMVSQENVPSDSVLTKTDTDATKNDSQEEVSDMKTYSIDGSNISEKNNFPLNSESDKKGAFLHEGCEIHNKFIETSGNFEDNLKSVKKEEPDEPTDGLENTTTEDKKHDKLSELESYVEKSGLPENEIPVKMQMNETEQATQKSPVKELVWEIKSTKHEPEQQELKDLLQKEWEQNVTENPTKKNPLVRAVPLEDVTECPPTKRPKIQPVWTTNPLNDEDKAKAERATYSDKTAKDVNTANETAAEAVLVNPYIISQEVKKQLAIWMLKSGIARPKAKYMLKLVNDARCNKAVLRMAPIPKDYKLKDVFRVIREQTKAYEKEVSKNIQYIHIHKYDDNFNAAYIKWRDIDKVLVVKAYQILVTTSFTVDGVVKQPLFKYDDRSIIDWNEMDRPILKQKDVDMEIPKTVSTPALAPVVTPIATVVATTSATVAAPVAKLVAASVADSVAATVAKPAATPVATPLPRKPPPPPFINGEIDVKDRKSFGLCREFMEYYNIKPPIVCFVFARNLDMSHSVEKYRSIFSAAGDILDIEVIPAPRHNEQLSLKLRIAFNHRLEAVQAVSMFHEQIVFGRVIEVEMGNFNMKRKPLNIEGFSAVGPGIGVNGSIMKNIRSNIAISKLRSRTKVELDTFKGQINYLKEKLAAATFKMEQAKRDEEKRRFIEEKKQMQSQNESQNKQASMDAVSAITTAIASSVQANVMGMLGIQPNQQGQNMNQNTPSAPVNNQPGGMPQNQNTSSAPMNWTANENTATALPNQNKLGQTSMENAFQNFGSELQGYQNPQDPYMYYANMQQAYAQYGYTMDQTLMQANAYVQPGTYIQPGIVNVQPVPAIDTSNMPPTTPQTQSMPTILSNPPVPSKPSIPTQSSKVHTQSKTVFPPLPTTNKNVNVYEIQKPPLRFDLPPAKGGNNNNTAALSRFDVPPAKVRQTTAAVSKVPEIPLSIPRKSQPAVKTAFKIQKPILPTKVTKQASINMKIPTVLPETVPLVVQNPRTLEKNSVQIKLMNLAGKLPAEPWINKQIRDMKKNSKSPERIRKSPEKIRSPVRKNSRSPIRRRSRSAERRRVSRSPKRRMSRSPIRRRSRSPARRRSRSPSPVRRRSRSPVRRRSRSPSPVRRRSRSPVRRRSRSPVRRRSRSTEKRRISRSPIRRISRSPVRRRSRSADRRRMSRSPKRRFSRSPKRGLSRSPVRRKSKSPVRRRSRSPKRQISNSPKRKSKSPVRRISKSPVRKISRSPVKQISRSPVRLSMPSSERKGISTSRSSELGPKPTLRPAYGPDGEGRDKTNLDLGDKTANYNYTRQLERELANTSVIFNFLPPSVTTKDLTDKMSEIGELLEVRAFGMGKAMVVFKFRHDAVTCIEMFNMAKVDGHTIEVRWASIE